MHGHKTNMNDQQNRQLVGNSQPVAEVFRIIYRYFKRIKINKLKKLNLMLALLTKKTVALSEHARFDW